MAIKPETAVELVGRYARLTLAIKGCKARIGAELDSCPGLKGFRLETERHEAIPESWMGPAVEAYDSLTERAVADQDTHLSIWYSDSYGEVIDQGYMDPAFRPYRVKEDREGAECSACYAAHLIVQERKTFRRQLASVKAAMTRLGSKA